MSPRLGNLNVWSDARPVPMAPLPPLHAPSRTLTRLPTAKALSTQNEVGVIRSPEKLKAEPLPVRLLPGGGRGKTIDAGGSWPHLRDTLLWSSGARLSTPNVDVAV